jgi:hypothetical protein
VPEVRGEVELQARRARLQLAVEVDRARRLETTTTTAPPATTTTTTTTPVVEVPDTTTSTTVFVVPTLPVTSG